MYQAAIDKIAARVKSLEEMTLDEWESLCDRCARCCLVKLEDEDSGDVHFTDIGCTLLDARTCRCRPWSSFLPARASRADMGPGIFETEARRNKTAPSVAVLFRPRPNLC